MARTSDFLVGVDAECPVCDGGDCECGGEEPDCPHCDGSSVCNYCGGEGVVSTRDVAKIMAIYKRIEEELRPAEPAQKRSSPK